MIHYIFMLLFLIPALVLAEVNPKTGYYTHTFDDVALKVGDKTLQLSRTYRSASFHSGWFGPGWSTPLEKRLIVGPNNTVYLRENGEVKVFQSGGSTSEPGGEMADTAAILQAISAKTVLQEADARALQAELLAKPEKRADYIEQYQLFGVSQSNAILHTACGVSQVVRLTTGYKRVRCPTQSDSQPVEYYDPEGRLVSLAYQDGYRIVLEYRNEPHGVIVRDNRAQSLVLTFANNGRLVALKTHQGHTLSYRYDGYGQLSEVEGSTDGPQRFKYAKDHLLTQIDDVNGEQYAIAYYLQTRQAREVIDRLQSTTTYEYGMDARDTNRQWTRKTTVSPNGREYPLHYQFQYAPQASQRRQLVHIVVQAPTETLEVHYDATGRIVEEKSSSGEYNAISYHPALNKIVEVRNQEGTTVYSYDKKGELQTAIGNQGNRIVFRYNADGTIRKIVETDTDRKSRREIRVRYNALQKPTVITLVGVGTIDVLYDAQGEINKVSSKGGAELALKITQSFQSFMAVLNVGHSRLSTKYFCYCS